MAISPDKAARSNDERINKAIKKEEERIDAVLRKKFYTGGPAVELAAPDTLDEPVSRMLMDSYKNVGWRIEVPANRESKVWKFTKL